MPTGRRKNEGLDWTKRYQQGAYDADNAEYVERFSNRSKFSQQMKMRRTAGIRADKQELIADVDGLPLGQVLQVYSLYVEIRALENTPAGEQPIFLAVMRRTLQRLAASDVVVGDLVRFRPSGTSNEAGQPEAVIERVLPRKTVLIRQDSFHKERIAPIVANAQQMLLVASVLRPAVKWGLVDRMLIAAQSGQLEPVICLNKMDLADPEQSQGAMAILNHYASLGVRVIASSNQTQQGITQLRDILTGKTTVLSGHSGVGKSSLIRAVAPLLDIRVGEVSNFNEKGRHTTTSARCYDLPFGGQVVDTPGIRQFGLMNVSAESLIDYFPDVQAGTAPTWREESYQHILESL